MAESKHQFPIVGENLHHFEVPVHHVDKLTFRIHGQPLGPVQPSRFVGRFPETVKVAALPVQYLHPEIHRVQHEDPVAGCDNADWIVELARSLAALADSPQHPAIPVQNINFVA